MNEFGGVFFDAKAKRSHILSPRSSIESSIFLTEEMKRKNTFIISNQFDFFPVAIQKELTKHTNIQTEQNTRYTYVNMDVYMLISAQRVHGTSNKFCCFNFALFSSPTTLYPEKNLI